MGKVLVLSDISQAKLDAEVLVYIACYNRPEMALSSLKSFCLQTNLSFNLILSDNSTDDRVQTCLTSVDVPMTTFYLRRRPSLPPPYSHAMAIYEEVHFLKPRFWMLFHDDDLVFPTYIDEMIAKMESYPSCSAVAANAVEFSSKGIGSLFRKDEEDMELRRPQALLERYFLPSMGVAPYPGYFYRGDVASLFMAPLQGGKYMDIWTNSNLFRAGPVLWLGRPSMLYRRHDLQDSKSHSLARKQALMRAFRQKGVVQRSDLIYLWFSVQNMKHKLLREPVWARLRRIFLTKAGRLFIKNLLRSLLSPHLIKLLVRKTTYDLSLKLTSKIKADPTPQPLIEVLKSEGGPRF